MNLKELREARGKALADARVPHEEADKEKRRMNEDEQGRFDAYMNEIDELDKQIGSEIRLQDAARVDAETHRESAAKPKDEKTLAEKRMDGFRHYLQRGLDPFMGDLDMTKEFRAMQQDLEVSGGYLAAPQEFIAELIQDVDDAHIVRQLARKFQLKKAVSLGAPSLDTDLSTSNWGAEITEPTADSSLALGKRELNPHPASGAIRVSRDLLKISVLNVDALVRERLANEVGELEDVAFMTGSGSNQPLGLFTASSDGISTGRDISSGNSSTNIHFDNFKRVKYFLKAQYWAKASWIMHRDVARNASLLKDGEGQYIWQQSVVIGDPDRILGFPVNLSENAPSTFSGSGYMAILGDYNEYWIADAYDMELQRLNELYAATNQVGFFIRLKVDGMPVKEEAFVRSQLV